MAEFPDDDLEFDPEVSGDISDTPDTSQESVIDEGESGAEMSLATVKPSALVTGAESWNEIVNQLVDELSKDDLPDKVVRATELLLSGYPTYKVAKKLNVKPATVRGWLSRYPTMAAIVANGKKLLAKWRMSVLEQQFISAVERSQEILEISLDGTMIGREGYEERVNPKILTVVAAQARYIIGLFAGQKVDVTVVYEMGDTVMKARNDALDYLAQRLAEQDAGPEPVEAVFRVIDGKVDDTGPFLDENGQPPFGQMGVLDTNDNGTLCHVCGRRFKSFAKHLLISHNSTAEDYETLYLLEEGSVRGSENR